MSGVGKEASGTGPWHLDLREVLLEQAARLGIAVATSSGHCTALEHREFHSHRRSGGRDGRMVAYLGLPAARGGG
jgi:copper oxidase (laccase) domain-containing protein